MSTFHQLVHSRRSVRKYDSEQPFNGEDVQSALELAMLSPNSSNMQMWQFHRVSNPELLEKVAYACMGQNAAKTANELVVFTVTPETWAQRAKANGEKVRQNMSGRTDKTALRAYKYYEKFIPFLYNNDRFGLRGLMRKVVVWYMGLKKPIVREVSRANITTTLHKNTSLAAMTFMYAMQDKGYATCAMEGFDSKRVKKLLNIPSHHQISMIISCGRAAKNGVYGPRDRLPCEQVIIHHS